MAWVYPLFAFFLDLAIGDPRWIPHPVTIIGKGISATESLLRGSFQGTGEKTAGVILVLVVVLPTAAVAFLVSRFLFSVSGNLVTVIGMLLFVYLASTTLALRGLISSALLVMKAVSRGNLTDARNKLAMIVGRDTVNLSDQAILRATIETVAENLSDGFVAPLFYLVIGGLPLAFTYKAINTLDSMVGYKNDKYLRFGWAAARLDDLANYVPARLTGLAIVAAAFLYFMIKRGPWSKLQDLKFQVHSPKLREQSSVGRALSAAANSFRILRRDGRNHTSPNSGIPEAAMAGALGIRLGGPSTYNGIVVEKPTIGDEMTGDYRVAADRTLALAMIAASLMVALSVAVLLLLRSMR
jgi:adenosylcobinamide-phosphate synthase